MKSKTDDQIRHEKLIDFLSQYPQYKLPKQKHTVKSFDVEDSHIINAVVMFRDALNLSGGSIGNFNLYNLMEAYLTVPECRDDINIIVNQVLTAKIKSRLAKE